MSTTPNSPFPWPNSEVGLRQFARVLFFIFAAIALTIAAIINYIMSQSTENSFKNMLIGIVFVGIIFGLEMWFTVVRRYRSAFKILKYTAYAILMASFAFDVYFGWDAFELGQNFSFFGDDNNVNAPAFTIFLAISSNIASLIALYYGIRNNWFYAAADNDSWG